MVQSSYGFSFFFFLCSNGIENRNNSLDVQSVATKSYGPHQFRFLRRRKRTLNTLGVCAPANMTKMFMEFCVMLGMTVFETCV